jgi:hypothetical protein
MGLAKYYEKFFKQDENGFKSWILNKLKEDFYIKQEVWGTHIEGGKLRIDALIKPKDTSEWANKDIVFGLEFKSPSRLIKLGDQCHYVKQAIDYSYTKFDKHGYVPILICPRIEFDESYSRKDDANLVRHLLCKFNVGELDYQERGHHHGLGIKMASKYIWSSTTMGDGKTRLFKKNFGSKK